MKIYDSWKREHLEDSNVGKIVSWFNHDDPTWGGWDTETTGLHIRKDKPFLIILGWLNKGEGNGRVFTFEPTKKSMRVFFEVARRMKYFVAWNHKYDIHMVSNIHYDNFIQSLDNLIEGMSVARLCLEAIPARDGGDSLALKDIGKKYVDTEADKAEDHIKKVKKELKDKRVKVLAAALKQFPLILNGEEQLTATGKPKMWGKKVIEDFLKDPTHDEEDLPENVREVWLEWKKVYGDGEPTYKDIYENDREGMIRYAGDDVITMMEFIRKAIPTLMQRDQGKVLERESKCILPLYRMERVGLPVDRERLENDRKNMKSYIRTTRLALYEVAGEVVNCNQHKRIKEIIESRLGINMEASDDSALKNLLKQELPEDVRKMIKLIRELRTLEKWYSTYIRRIQKASEFDGRFYTQISQSSAVSGRVGSDSQQFPKKAVLTRKGQEIEEKLKKEPGNKELRNLLKEEELFHPRNIFITPKGWKWYLLDFSQVELRVQANYTLLVSGGDLNLCRAYFPFKCRNKLTGEGFNYKNPEHMKQWNSGEWLMENGEPWKPTDVHGATTHKAFPHIPLGTDEFTEWRSKGKMFNFMANYGGSKKAAMKSLDLSEEHADALVRGYSEAFPQVLMYQKKVAEQHQARGYVQNHYGRRYYIQDTRKAYKLANYLIQGENHVPCQNRVKSVNLES